MHAKGQVKGTEGPPGTYRSSSVLRSSWSRGSCCLRPRSSHPQWSGLGCSHLWGWQKEPHFGKMQADSRGQGWGSPWIPLPTRERVALPVALPARVWASSMCLIDCSSPHALCAPVTRTCPGGPCHTSRPRSCCSLCSVTFSQRTPTHPSRPSPKFFSLTFTGRAWSAPPQ